MGAPNKSRCRLCVLLVLIVCNYYLISEGNSLNVKVDTCTRKNQWDSLLDKNIVSSYPVVVKLRDLATSKNRHKKRRTLTRFEAFIWLSIMGLRSVIALINALLLRAGDVELNPGPTPPPSPTRELSQAANVPGDNSDQLPDTNPMVALHGQMLQPLSETTASPNVLASDRKVIGHNAPTSQSVLSSKVSPKHFSGETSGAQDSDLTANIEEYDASEPATDSVVKVEPSRTKPLDLEEKVVKLRERLLDVSLPEKSKRSLLYDLFVHVNIRYRSEERCSICPICLNRKADSGGQRKSHVIPEGILKCYWKIHHVCEETAFILDFSRNQRLTAGSLTYRLLCGDCEKYYGRKGEEELKSVYLDIAADPNRDVEIMHNEMEQTSWLKYILGNILLRGILTNVDLQTFWSNTQVVKAVYSLWKYCSHGRFNLQQMQCYNNSEVPNLKIFLLPYKSFNEALGSFFHPFEMLLRMPCCTELIMQEEGMFFYTKFDCFHVVLPVCDRSINYFDTFNEGVTVADNGGTQSIYLRWAVHPKAEITREGKALKYSYGEKSPLHDHFPEALMKWCASLYPKFMSRLHNHSTANDPFLACLDRFHDSYYIGFCSKERIQLADKLKRDKARDERPSRKITYKKDCKKKDEKEIEVYISNASERSPLKKREISWFEFKAKKAQLERTISEKDSKIREMKIKLKTQTAELVQLGSARMVAQESLEEANRVIKAYEEKLFFIQAERERERSDFFSLRTELQQKWEEGMYHQEFSAINIEHDLADMEKTRMLYFSSQRHQQHQSVVLLKDILQQRVVKFKNLAELSREFDPSAHRTYKTLFEECNTLLNSPPNSPS